MIICILTKSFPLTLHLRDNLRFKKLAGISRTMRAVHQSHRRLRKISMKAERSRSLHMHIRWSTQDMVWEQRNTDSIYKVYDSIHTDTVINFLELITLSGPPLCPVSQKTTVDLWKENTRRIVHWKHVIVRTLPFPFLPPSWDSQVSHACEVCTKQSWLQWTRVCNLFDIQGNL